MASKFFQFCFKFEHYTKTSILKRNKYLCVFINKFGKHQCTSYVQTFHPHICRNLSTSCPQYFKKLSNFNEDAAINAKGVPRQISKSEIQRLFSLAKPELPTLVGAFVLLIVSSTVTMLVPFALGNVIDIIYKSDLLSAKHSLDKICIFLFSIFCIGGLANFGRVYLINITGQRITKHLRSLLFASILKQEIAFFDKNKTGELVNRLSSDTAVVSNSLTMNISDGLRSVIMVFAGIGMMVYMSPQLALVGLSIIPPVSVMAVLYGRYIRNLTRKVQDRLADATQLADERISNVRTVRSFGQEEKEIGNYGKRVNDVLHLAYKESLAKGIFFGLTGLSGNAIVLIVLYYGGVLVTRELISVGHLSSFLLYAAYVGIAVGGISSFYSEMSRGLGATTRIFELIDSTPQISTFAGAVLPYEKLRGEVKFQNISFAYPSRPDLLVLKDFSLCIEPGTFVAVVGASGSGKSTVGFLVLRLYDPCLGSIFVDGIPIDRLDPVWLRQSIAYVSQEPILFSTTIKENITYGIDKPVSDEILIDIAKQANAYEFIQLFPQKFDTSVGERGVMLSGGQKQRIAIARALMTDPKILLLDEATSALDAENLLLVEEALERIMKNRTVIKITHHLSTISNADKVAVLQNGSVAEIGSFRELSDNSNSLFSKLLKMQNFN